MADLYAPVPLNMQGLLLLLGVLAFAVAGVSALVVVAGRRRSS